MDDLTRDFASEMLDALDLVEGEVLGANSGQTNGAALHAKAFRLLHTIKGTCGFLSLPLLEALAHTGEDNLAALGGQISASGSDLAPLLRDFDQIRAVLNHLVETGVEPATAPAARQPADSMMPHAHISADNLEHLLADVGALGQASAALLATARPLELPNLHGQLQDVAQIAARLESRMSRVTMQSIEAAWRHVPRVARQIAEEQGKAVRVEMAGGATAIDRGMFSVVRDIIVHLVRNGVAHGIETIEERRALGKADHGLIRLSAREQAGRIMLHVSDDGRGFDPEHPVACGVDDPVTRISGRGVGLAAVRAVVDQAGGTMHVAGGAGAGTRFEIELPLIVAVVPCLMIEAGGASFALPQSALLEIIRAPGEAMREVSCRSGTVSIVDVAAHFGLRNDENAARFIAVCGAGDRRFGLMIEGVGETEALSLKPLGFTSDGIRPFNAAAIAGDGSIVLVIDPGHFGVLAGRSAPAESQPQMVRRKVRMLPFETGDEVPRSVRLTHLKRVCMAGVRGDVPAQILPAADAATADVTLGPLLVIEGPDGDIGLPVGSVGDVVTVEEQSLPPVGARAPAYAAYKGDNGSVVHILNPAGHVRHLLPPPRTGVLLLEPDALCRGMIAAALTAAGHRIFAVPPEETALPDDRFAAVIVDLDGDWARGVLAGSAEQTDGGVRRIGISARFDAETARLARALDVATVVGKFDRAGLKCAIMRGDGAELAA